MTRRSARPRTGFTLIELLIVIGIITVLATLAFLFVPNLDRNKGVPNAVTQLEGYIRLSKAQALRDGAPRGIRLITDPNDATRVTALQYIEQPDPVAPRGTGVSLKVETVTNMMTGQPTHTATLTATENWDSRGVAAGDFLEITASPFAIRRIQSVNGFDLVLDQGVEGTDAANGGTPLTLTDGFRVIRSPRPLVGEPMLQMNKDVYIDLTRCSPCPPPYTADADTNFYASSIPWAPTGQLDILFNSSGQVANATSGQIMLCVKHVDRDNDRLIVVVYTRTGKVSAVIWNDVPGADPYFYARDGQNSGL